jgi:hypothetical protein
MREQYRGWGGRAGIGWVGWIIERRCATSRVRLVERLRIAWIARTVYNYANLQANRRAPPLGCDYQQKGITVEHELSDQMA